MALETQVETAAFQAQVSTQPTPSTWLSVSAIWIREVRGFYRQRVRVVAALATPLLFWLILGSGFGNSVSAGPAGGSYLDFFFPGAVTLVVLFTSIFSNISVIEARREGFLLSVLAAPVPRYALVLGKALGATTIGALQGILFLPLVPMLGLSFPWSALPTTAALLFTMSLGLTGLGFFFAWRLNSTQGFHSVMNLVLMPMWLLSGALFPASGSASWMSWLMAANPRTYGVTELRRLLGASPQVAGPTSSVCWAVTGSFAAVGLAIAVWEASRPSAKNLS